MTSEFFEWTTSEPALDTSVPIIEMFPGELDSDDEDNDTICVDKDDPLHTSVATHGVKGWFRWWSNIG